MKELKFRVWDKVKQQMLKPQAISFDVQSLAPFAVSVPRRSWEPIGKFELLQWTGLADVNGVEVFESDFVKISSVLYKVTWSKTTAGFELEEVSGPSKLNIRKVAVGTVVGNQFENSDLTTNRDNSASISLAMVEQRLR